MDQKDAPKPQKVITEDPLNVFRFETEWSTSAFSCCEDLKLSMFKYEIFKYEVLLVLFVFIFSKLGLYSYFCWTCVVCSLIQDLKESCCTFMCIPCPLIVYRMKMRSNLRIRVNYN